MKKLILITILISVLSCESSENKESENESNFEENVDCWYLVKEFMPPLFLYGDQKYIVRSPIKSVICLENNNIVIANDLNVIMQMTINGELVEYSINDHFRNEFNFCIGNNGNFVICNIGNMMFGIDEIYSVELDSNFKFVNRIKIPFKAFFFIRLTNGNYYGYKNKIIKKYTEDNLEMIGVDCDVINFFESHNGNLLAVHSDGSVREYKEDGEAEIILTLDDPYCQLVQLDNRKIVTGHKNGWLKYWDINGELISEINTGSKITAMAKFKNEKNVIVTCHKIEYTCQLKVWQNLGMD